MKPLDLKNRKPGNLTDRDYINHHYKKLSIIIPCYNEYKTLPLILKEIEKVSLPHGMTKEIIVVNDGSSDNTNDFMLEYTVNASVKTKYIEHKKNSGKGSAIRSGLKHVTGDIVIIQDADLEYDPNDYTRLITPIIQGKSEVVYGSRFLVDNKSRSKFSLFQIGSDLVTLVANVLFWTKLTDEATCYKTFKTKIIKNIPLKCEKFEFCPEITAKILKRKIEILEIPISYTPRSIKDGKKIKYRDGFTAIWTLLKYRFVN